MPICSLPKGPAEGDQGWGEPTAGERETTSEKREEETGGRQEQLPKQRPHGWCERHPGTQRHKEKAAPSLTPQVTKAPAAPASYGVT